MTTYTYCPECATELEERELEGVVRRVCRAASCGFVHYDNPTPVVAAIVQRGQDVILVRSVGWPESWYGLVTGFLERDEEPEEGVVREVAEELGLQAELVGMVGIYTFSQMNQLILAYHVEVQGEVVLGEELADYKVVPIAKLRPWPFGTGQAVADWLGTRGQG